MPGKKRFDHSGRGRGARAPKTINGSDGASIIEKPSESVRRQVLFPQAAGKTLPRRGTQAKKRATVQRAALSVFAATHGSNPAMLERFFNSIPEHEKRAFNWRTVPGSIEFLKMQAFKMNSRPELYPGLEPFLSSVMKKLSKTTGPDGKPVNWPSRARNWGKFLMGKFPRHKPQSN